MDYKILNIRICSGSTNDRFIWRWCDAWEYLHELRRDIDIMDEEGTYFIIGNNQTLILDTYEFTYYKLSFDNLTFQTV